MTDHNRPRVVLYIEDERVVRLIVSHILNNAGFIVRTAENGQAGVDAAFAEPPDLILTDLMMPVMDGYEAARVLRADPRTSHIPIVAYTAAAQASVREKVRDAGILACIAKSAPPGELVAAVQGCLAAASRQP